MAGGALAPLYYSPAIARWVVGGSKGAGKHEKDGTKGLRGHSSLYAALDAAIEAKRVKIRARLFRKLWTCLSFPFAG